MRLFVGVLTAGGLLFAAVAFASGAGLSHSLEKFGVLEDTNLIGQTSECKRSPTPPGTSVDFLSISDCQGMPCIFVVGQTYTVKVNLTCGTKVDKFRVTAAADLFGIFIDFFNKPDQSNSSCDAGGTALIVVQIVISDTTPTGKFTLEIEAKSVDASGAEQSVACRRGQIEVRSA